MFTLCIFANFRIFHSLIFLGTMFSCASTVIPNKNVGILRIKRTKKMPVIKKDFLRGKKTQNVFKSIKTHHTIKPLRRTIWWSQSVQLSENRWIVSYFNERSQSASTFQKLSNAQDILVDKEAPYKASITMTTLHNFCTFCAQKIKTRWITLMKKWVTNRTTMFKMNF